MLTFKKEDNGFLVQWQDCLWCIDCVDEVADILTFSTEEKKKIKSRGFVISWPGEYETQGIEVFWFQATEEKVMYGVDIEGKTCVYIPQWVDAIVPGFSDNVGDIDVLIVQVGAQSDCEALRKSINQNEPRVLIITGEAKDSLIKHFEWVMYESSVKVDALSQDKTFIYWL